MREPPSVTDSALAILSHFTQSASTPFGPVAARLDSPRHRDSIGGETPCKQAPARGHKAYSHSLIEGKSLPLALT